MNMFLVSEASIMSLLQFCFTCSSGDILHATRCVVVDKYVEGNFLAITTKCILGHNNKWRSQAFHKNKALGNVLLASALLCSGCIISQTLRMFSFMHVQCFSERTFYRIQHAYLTNSITKVVFINSKLIVYAESLIKTILQVWTEQQESLVSSRQNLPMVFVSDGRCDSMGHCAKYYTYYVKDMTSNKVVDVQVIKVSLRVSW